MRCHVIVSPRSPLPAPAAPVTATSSHSGARGLPPPPGERPASLLQLISCWEPLGAAPNTVPQQRRPAGRDCSLPAQRLKATAKVITAIRDGGPSEAVDGAWEQHLLKQQVGWL